MHIRRDQDSDHLWTVDTGTLIMTQFDPGPDRLEISRGISYQSLWYSPGLVNTQSRGGDRRMVAKIVIIQNLAADRMQLQRLCGF